LLRFNEIKFYAAFLCEATLLLEMFAGLSSGGTFAAMLDHLEDAGLEILHDRIRPETCVGVEVGGEALVACEVE